MARILLMEDDPDQAFLVAEFLRRDGHEVVDFPSGLQALAALEADPDGFDAIVTDLFVRRGYQSVPNGGLTLIGRIRAQELLQVGPEARRMPIIAISGGYAATAPDVLTLAAGIGADACFSKPMDMSDLTAKLRELLGDRA